MNSQPPPLLSGDENVRIALERLAAFRKDGLAHPIADRRAWFDTRRPDPDAACPPAKTFGCSRYAIPCTAEVDLILVHRIHNGREHR